MILEKLKNLRENAVPFYMYEFVYRHNYVRYMSYPVAALFITACVLFGQWPTKYEFSVDTIGDKFYTYVLTIMILVSAIFGALHAAISITTEKERKTLTMLRMSGLAPGEIIIGKALNSFMFIMLIVMPQLPLLVACPFLGGVSISKALAGVLIFAVVTFLYNVMGTCISILFKKNFMSTSVTIAALLFFHFGLYWLDEVFFSQGYSYGRRSWQFFSYFSPIEVWSSFFAEFYPDYRSQASRYLLSLFDIEVSLHAIVVPLYFLVAVFLCQFAANRFEGYLKWRED